MTLASFSYISLVITMTIAAVAVVAYIHTED
jgi:hypothetical protein